jgi:enoyl-CoA hydratase/carnithine racemase
VNRLADAIAVASVDPARPAPICVRGTAAEWALPSGAQLGRQLRECPAATIAIIEGDAPESAVLDAFDLLVDAANEDLLEQYLAVFDRNPQAATVLARLVSESDHSLNRESATYSMLQSGPEFRRWLTVARPAPHRDPPPRVDLTMSERGATIVLTRPGRRNAFDSLMREELCDALDAAALGEARQVIIYGAGRSFSSGGDLGEFGKLMDPVHAHLVRTGRSVAGRLDRLAPSLLIGVHGPCVGAGVEFAAFAGRLLAEAGTTFRLPEVSYGLIPGAGGTVSLPRRIGRRHFLDFALTGRTIDAAVALEWGLVDEVVPTGTLLNRLRVTAELAELG